MQREANAPKGGLMEEPSRKTMASAFAITNKILHQTANKSPTSASVYRASNTNDEATIGMDVELATPPSDPPLE